MALRFALASVAGGLFGGLYTASRDAAQAQEKEKKFGSYEHSYEGFGFPVPEKRDGWGSKADGNAGDVFERQQEAKRLAAQYDDHGGRIPSKGAITFRFAPYKLGEVINLTEETAIFRFLLPKADDLFIMEACSTLQAMKKEPGLMAVEQVQRMYTPITPNHTKGYFDILVKKQPRGRMTEHLFGMKIGESLHFRVIQHKMRYLPNVYDEVGLIGTGSGITPLLQVIRASVSDPRDNTKLSLLFANPSDHRVLLKGTLDRLVAESKGRFKTFYTVDKVLGPEPWQGFVGYIDAGMIARTMPKPAPRNILMVCGSDQLMNSLCGVPLAVMKPWSSGHAQQPAVSHSGANFSDELGGVLGSLGYRSEHVYRF